jgi:glycerophosphoryl diester phosphodiesterase
MYKYLLLLAFIPISPVERITDDFYHHQEKILVAAHRAAHNIYPENSLPAIKRAIEKGIDIVELDIRETKDGRLVIMHDKDLNRTTNGKGLVNTFTYKELKQLKLKQGDSLTTAHIPTLEEVFTMTKGSIMVDLDFKAETPTALKETLRLIKVFHVEKEVLFFVYDVKDAEDCKDVPVMPRVHNQEEVRTVLDMKRFPVMHIDDSFYSDSLMQAVQKSGVRVWANALGKYDDMEETRAGSGFAAMRKMKWVNVIQTNYPEELLAYLRKEGYHR